MFHASYSKKFEYVSRYVVPDYVGELRYPEPFTDGTSRPTAPLKGLVSYAARRLLRGARSCLSFGKHSLPPLAFTSGTSRTTALPAVACGRSRVLRTQLKLAVKDGRASGSVWSLERPSLTGPIVRKRPRVRSRTEPDARPSSRVGTAGFAPTELFGDESLRSRLSPKTLRLPHQAAAWTAWGAPQTRAACHRFSFASSLQSSSFAPLKWLSGRLKSSISVFRPEPI